MPPASTLMEIPLGTLGSKAAVGRTLDSEPTPGSDVTEGRLGIEPAEGRLGSDPVEGRLGSDVTEGRLGNDPVGLDPPVEPEGTEGTDGSAGSAGSDGVEGRPGSPDDPDGPDTHTVAPLLDAWTDPPPAGVAALP